MRLCPTAAGAQGRRSMARKSCFVAQGFVNVAFGRRRVDTVVVWACLIPSAGLHLHRGAVLVKTHTAVRLQSRCYSQLHLSGLTWHSFKVHNPGPSLHNTCLITGMHSH